MKLLQELVETEIPSSFDAAIKRRGLDKPQPPEPVKPEDLLDLFKKALNSGPVDQEMLKVFTVMHTHIGRVISQQGKNTHSQPNQTTGKQQPVPDQQPAFEEIKTEMKRFISTNPQNLQTISDTITNEMLRRRHARAARRR